MIEQRMAARLASIYRFNYPFVGAKLRQLKNARFGVTVWDAQLECHLFILCTAGTDFDVALAQAQKHVNHELKANPAKYPMGYQAAVCMLQGLVPQVESYTARLFLLDVSFEAPVEVTTGTVVA